jgi:hypothetical protein
MPFIFSFREEFCKARFPAFRYFPAMDRAFFSTWPAPIRGSDVRQELNVLALIKGEERYVYVYDEESREKLINLFRDQAADPRLALSWLDVPLLCNKAREQARAAADEPPAESRI